jgi:hypothetical protein
MYIVQYILSRVLVTKTGFGLIIGFIKNPQVVTTFNCHTVTDLHILKSLHTNLFSLSAIVFIYLQNGSYTLQISMHHNLQSHTKSSQAYVLYSPVLLVSIHSASLPLPAAISP